MYRFTPNDTSSSLFIWFGEKSNSACFWFQIFSLIIKRNIWGSDCIYSSYNSLRYEVFRIHWLQSRFGRGGDLCVWLLWIFYSWILLFVFKVKRHFSKASTKLVEIKLFTDWTMFLFRVFFLILHLYRNLYLAELFISGNCFKTLLGYFFVCLTS